MYSNLAKRLFTAAILAPIILWIICFSNYYVYFGFVSFVTTLMYLEWYGLNSKVLNVMVLPLFVILQYFGYVHTEVFSVAVLYGWFVIFFLVYLLRNEKGRFQFNNFIIFL